MQNEGQLRNRARELLGKPMLGGFLYNGSEIMESVEPPRDWGPWRLDTDVWVLYPVTPYRYEVDLEDCLTSAKVLDWIMQISMKNWADDACIAGLIRALGDVLNPQASLCSCGASKVISKRRARELAAQAALDRAESARVYADA